MSTTVAKRKLETKIENQRQTIVALKNQLEGDTEAYLKLEKKLTEAEIEIAYQKRQNKRLKGERDVQLAAKKEA